MIFFILPIQVNGNKVIRLNNKYIRKNQQDLSVLFSRISLSTSSKVPSQENMAAVFGVQDLYLTTLNLSTLEHLNIYNKLIVIIVMIPDNVRYVITRTKWTDFYQELEGSLYEFGLKLAVHIITVRDNNQPRIKFNNIHYQIFHGLTM